MRQIGIDICNLPEVDGYRHLIVCIDYFSKWSEAKATKDKSAPTVAQFIYDIICRHGCVKIQINDQGKEFVNEVSKNLHEMTGTEQRVTSSSCLPSSKQQSLRALKSNNKRLFG